MHRGESSIDRLDRPGGSKLEHSIVWQILSVWRFSNLAIPIDAVDMMLAEFPDCRNSDFLMQAVDV